MYIPFTDLNITDLQYVIKTLFSIRSGPIGGALPNVNELSCILFKKLFQILPHFTSSVHFNTLIGFALSVGISIGNEKMSAFPHYRLCVYPGQKGIHSNLGHPFVELAVNGGISIYTEERQIFSHYQC